MHPTAVIRHGKGAGFLDAGKVNELVAAPPGRNRSVLGNVNQSFFLVAFDHFRNSFRRIRCRFNVWHRTNGRKSTVRRSGRTGLNRFLLCLTGVAVVNVDIDQARCNQFAASIDYPTNLITEVAKVAERLNLTIIDQYIGFH